MSSFSEAFAKARKEGKKTFEWNGKSYSTKLKGEENNRGGARDNKPKFRSRNDEIEAERESKPKKPIAKKSSPKTGRFSEPKQKSLEQRSDNTRVARPQAVPKHVIPKTREAQTRFAEQQRETKPHEIGRKMRQAINESPALALADKYMRSKVTHRGTQYEDGDIPIGQYNVLSDQNQYIWDNIQGVLQTDISKLQSSIASETNPARKAELQNTLQTKSKYLDLARKGILADYLRLHPDEKVVVGGSFRHYKDANQRRFPGGTPTGYAGFGKDRYLEYAMNTPLGQTETIWGSALHSYRVDPATGAIITAVSDTYDFNPYSSGKSNEGNLVGQLRKVAGNDPSLGEKSSTKITRRMNLRPILPGQSNYITDPNEFGVFPEEGDPFYGLANEAVVPLLSKVIGNK